MRLIKYLEFLCKQNPILIKKSHGFSVQQFVKQIVEDPFGSRKNIELQNAYEDYRRQLNCLSPPNQDLTIKTIIVSRTYKDVCDELPHFVYNSVHFDKLLYSVPSHDFLQTKKVKSGDAISAQNEIFEFKTRFELNVDSHKQILSSYKQNVLNNTFKISILYNIFSSDFNRRAFIEELMRINLMPEHITFISAEELRKLSQNTPFLDDFFDKYSDCLRIYNKNHYSYLKNSCQTVLQHSSRPEIISSVTNFYNCLDEEASSYPIDMRAVAISGKFPDLFFVQQKTRNSQLYKIHFPRSLNDSQKQQKSDDNSDESDSDS